LPLFEKKSSIPTAADKTELPSLATIQL
jgi:hypothetical protein